MAARFAFARSGRRLAAIVIVALLACGLSVGGPAAGAGSPLVVGAVFPLRGNAAGLAGEERAGVEIARDLVNADGGVAGRPIVIEVQDVERDDAAGPAIAALRGDGAAVVIGSYSSALSMAVSSAADAEGLVYWESGAVADRLTGRGLPDVFRVGANGTTLGANSARFAGQELAPRLGKEPGQLRVALVAAEDDYARSVADAAAEAARAEGLKIVTRLDYDLMRPSWGPLVGHLADAAPDVIILSSHVDDGVAFRRAMLAAGLKVGALVGSTMAQCGPDWGIELGADAIGTFASDRPMGTFDPDALAPDARATYDRLAGAWAERFGGPPTEEGLAGFSAAWALFHDVMPAAASARDLGPAGIAAAARGLDLPMGALPNGAGLLFSERDADLGQNERAAGVVWQWQAIEHSETVWPPAWATGPIGFVPLPR